jgi:GT2 family glycosyltransferase
LWHVRPKVSIVIVNLNRAALTLDCVQSIFAHTERDLYEIIVVDNGSAAAEAETLVQAPHQFKLVLLNRNMFFGEASNIGAEQGSGDYVLFLNNDVKVTAGWLDGLLAALNAEYRAGAVGPKIVYPNGELQEAGCVVRPDGWGVQIGKSGMRLPPSFIDVTRIVDYCSGACLLMRKKVFLDLGGFDPIFDPAYFEDVDLAIRLRSIGLFTYYCGKTAVYHEESVTSNQIWLPEQRNHYIAVNHDRLMKRWGHYLEGRIDRSREPEPLASIAWEPETAPNGKKTIVVYSSNPLTLDSSSQSLLRVAAALQGFCNLTIAADEICSRCRVYSFCREFAITLKSFKVRKLSAVDPANCQLIVGVGADVPSSHRSAQHFVFERDGQQLLRFMDSLTCRGI